MLETLTDKFSGVFRSLAGRGRISEENIRESMQEVRTALLDADVNVQVVKDFTDRVIQKAIGEQVIRSLQPGQLMIKIVNDELVELMGPVDTRIYYVQPPPTIIMMCGLQGSGKTTTCGKLAKMLLSQGHHPLLAAADLQRPAAVEQLRVLGSQVGVPVYSDQTKVAEHGHVARGSAVAVCRAAVAEAKSSGRDVVILDTAGRLHIDDELMGELRDVNAQLKPHQVFLVLDAMSGQDAVNSAKAFNDQLEIDGLILTKFDSDTRGGALLSAKMVTGKPVKFLGTGEKLEALEEFRPEGMAQRILGMGDIVGLVTEAMTKFDQDETARLQAKMEKGTMTLEDFMAQMGQINKLGPISKVMGMIPGMSQLTQQMNEGDVEGQMGRMRAIYDSMNSKERKNTDMLDTPRRRRIARGAGVQVNDVGQFVKQFEQTRDMMKAVSGMGVMGKMGLMKNLMSGNLAGLGMPGGPSLKTKKGGFMEKKDRNKEKASVKAHDENARRPFPKFPHPNSTARPMCVDESMHTPLYNLPFSDVGVSTPIAIALGGFGVVLWLTGAVWSRSLVTLILVAAGTWIGMHLPRWCGWHVDDMAPAIGGAIVLGAAGYALHRWWIGLAVGWTCALVALGIAAPVVGILLSHDGGQLAFEQRLDAPRERVSVMADNTLSAVTRADTALSARHAAPGLWDLLRPMIREPGVELAIAAGAVGFLIGLMIAVRWPRLSASLVWSDIGLSLAGTMGLIAILRTHLEWMERLPPPGIAWILTPLALFALGAGIQFYLAGRTDSNASAAADVDAED